ncbi:MAG: 3-hydroxyacyl-CoA dehydrogenase family protein [Dehalococcoidales bacterium]|nr:3-hydroxyacyl-CoA dehydrogenase family protein [Dehalococcoidales bacterium]
MKLTDIKNISIIGAGTMGHGIALTYAWGGYQVALNDINETVLANAMGRIRDDLTTLVEGELISREAMGQILSRITTTTNLNQAVKGADFVTEAVSENIPIKRKIFADLDTFCPQHTILASNTSSLVLRDFTDQARRKDKLVITHWMNPPHLVPVVEVVRGEGTSDETTELACALLKKARKVPVTLKKEVPGFVINRVQYALLREVWSLWQRGVASAEDIDTIVRGSLGFRWAAIGPLETSDLGGLDVFSIVAENLFKDISDTQEPPKELKEMVKAGNLGLKSGQGFYKYSVGRGPDSKVRERDRKHMQLLKLWYS